MLIVNSYVYSAHCCNPRIKNGEVICRGPRPTGSTFLQAVYELQKAILLFKVVATLSYAKVAK